MSCNYISSEQFWDQVKEKFIKKSSKERRNSFNLEFEKGKIDLHYYQTNSRISYFSFNSEFSQDTIVENLSNQDKAFICFNTGADIYMKDVKKEEEVQWKNNSCWCGKQYDGHLSGGMYLKNQKNSIIYIILDHEIFNKLLGDKENYIDAKQIYKSDYIDVKYNNYINSKQRKTLSELSHLQAYTDDLQSLYLESKVLDLVYHSFHELKKQKKEKKTYISSHDINSLYKAKQILLENIENPPSLKELAYKAAINEFKLKKGFKELFGNTVYGFLQEHRLEEAKKLLLANEININEASLMVGYKSVSHFSKIFKDYFGVTPIEIKKEQKRIYI